MGKNEKIYQKVKQYALLESKGDNNIKATSFANSSPRAKYGHLRSKTPIYRRKNSPKTKSLQNKEQCHSFY